MDWGSLTIKHYLTVLKTLALAGDIWPVIAQQSGILLLYAILCASIALRLIRKKVA